MRHRFHHQIQILCHLKRFLFRLTKKCKQQENLFYFADVFVANPVKFLLAIRRDFQMHKEEGNENLQKIKSPLGGVCGRVSRAETLSHIVSINLTAKRAPRITSKQHLRKYFSFLMKSFLSFFSSLQYEVSFASSGK